VVGSSLLVPLPALALSFALDGPDVVVPAIRGLGPEAVVSTLYTAGLASLVGYAIFNNLLARYPASQVVPFVLIAPPVAMVSAWALLGQAPNLAEAAGGIVVLAGVLVTVWQSAPGARSAGQSLVTRDGVALEPVR
jgi:O-acetylserine/cysteine efflux transporter